MVEDLIQRYKDRLKYLPPNPYYEYFWMEKKEIEEKIKELEKVTKKS